MAMRKTYSCKCTAVEEPRGDFKRDHRIHEILGEVVKCGFYRRILKALRAFVVLLACCEGCIGLTHAADILATRWVSACQSDCFSCRGSIH
jgi:hypothetical protein